MADFSIASSARPKISSRTRLQTDRLTGKPVLLYPEGALILNKTAHDIASLCNGQITLDEIVLKLSERYERSSSEIFVQVEAFLNRLREKNLVELIA